MYENYALTVIKKYYRVAFFIFIVNEYEKNKNFISFFCYYNKNNIKTAFDGMGLF